MTEEDSQEYGSVYSLTAIKSDIRLFLFHHEGKRSAKDAIELFAEIEKMREASSPVPVFVSDDWDAFEEGLVNVYGQIELPEYKGIGRKPLPKLIPAEDLKYIKVYKKKVKGYVVSTVSSIVFGNADEIFEMLGACSEDYIGTSYVERINLTIRTCLARFIRKGVNFSKTMIMHQKALDFFQAWYNFIKPHNSLKLKVDSQHRKWLQRTPAMAENITDHIWSLKELLTFRVPIQ
ncbi:MAG: IS1 family transposase [Methanolobus sp.]|uniref:IS1 family transposase n=1 Tax=Methanolobus sp. TaxID=1874737 RepID=UPI002731CCE6|nr:IS1 family transposase [Methanolobus sp.]MDP2215879.1 IS1 family transposase [Methanolobus sp.]